MTLETVLNRDQARMIDRLAIEEYGIPGIVLMENAGRGCFEVLKQRGIAGPVVICCGPGNNGGDGFVIARHLDNVGFTTKVIVFGSPRKMAGDAKTNFEIIRKMEIPIVVLEELEPERWSGEVEFIGNFRTEWAIDALLGTGATGPPRFPLDRLVQLMNTTKAKRMAIDIPTGMDCDTGVCHQPTFSADVTCTFVARKPAFSQESALRHLGDVEVIDIGVPRCVIDKILNEKG